MNPVGVFGGDLLGHPDRLVGAARGGRADDLGTVHPQQQASFLAGVLRHDHDQPVAAQLGHHGQGDAGVPRGGLQDHRTGLQQAFLFRLRRP